jgi:hypothetical protein
MTGAAWGRQRAEHRVVDWFAPVGRDGECQVVSQPCVLEDRGQTRQRVEHPEDDHRPKTTKSPTLLVASRPIVGPCSAIG